MAVNVGDLEATIRLLDELSPALKKTEDNVKGFSAKSSMLMGVFQGAGIAAFQAVSAAAVRMAVDVPKALFEAASAAEESENLFAVSFGNMADEARAWSVELAAATGQNEFELRKNSATLFVMMESMGVATEAAYEMATSLTALAGDMASFYDLPHEVAFQKIQAGISGEAEPLKRLGIIVLEHTVKQAALTHGLIKQGEAMDEATKVQARYLAIMDQTVRAQGDLARTIDSPTNAVRALKAQWEALQIHMGQALMPVFRAIIKVMGGLLATIMDNKDAITLWLRTMAEGVVGILPTVVTGMQHLDNTLTVLTVGYRSFRHGVLAAYETLLKGRILWNDLQGDYSEVKELNEKLAKVQKDIADNAEKAGESLDRNGKRANELWGPLKQTAEDIVKQVTELGSGGSGGKAMEEFNTSTDKAAKAMADLNAEMDADAMERMADETATMDEEIAKAAADAKKLADELAKKETALALKLAKDEAKELADETERAAKAAEKAAKESMVKWKNALQGLAGVAGMFSGDLEATVGIIGNIGEGFKNATTDAEKFGAIASGIGQIGGLIAKKFEKVGKAIQGAASGAQAGFAIGGPWGAAIGGAIGGVAGFISGIGAAERATNDLRDQFFDSVGGFEEFGAMMEEIGESGEEWTLKLFNAKTVEEFNALVEEATGLIDEHKAALQLEADAWAGVEEAAERYGLTLEEMGPAFAQRELTEKAGQLYQDFQLLIAAGADVNAVLAKMGPEVSDFVNQSIKAGVAIPAAMEPMLRQMAEAGTLLDENGNQITDLDAAGVTFAQTMDEMFMGLMESVEKLVNALLGINDIDVSPNVNIPSGGGGRPPHHDPDREAQAGFFSPAMPSGPRERGGTDIRVHPGEEVSITPAGRSGGGEGGGQPVQVQVHIGGEKLYDMLTRATKSGQVRVYPDAVKSF
jgi:hypothetical protein